MTTNYHTPISDGDSNAASTVNTPLGTLDAQLTTNTSEITTARGAYGNLDARLDALVAAGGNVATLTEDSATANGATTINVDSTTGLIVGARIVYTLSDGNLEYNTIATIPDGTSITVDTGVDSGGSATIPGNTYLAMISPSEYAAATAINYGNSVTPTLADAVQWAAGNVHNVLAYGAAGDSGTTNNTTAFAAVVTAASAGDVMLIPRASGYYEVDTTVTISKAMTIVIQGEVRSGDTAATPTESVFKITASNCKVIFEGGKIRGYGNYTSDSTPPSLIWCEGTSTANPIRNVDIINPHLEEPPSAAIWFRYCNDSRVMGGLIEGGSTTNITTNTFAILNTDSTNISVIGTHYRQNSSNGAVSQFYNAANSGLTEMRSLVQGCVADGLWDKLVYQVTPGASVIGNRVVGRGATTVSGGIRVGGDAIVSDNYIDSTWGGAIQVYTVVSGGSNLAIENVVINNNVITNCANSGIEIGYLSGTNYTNFQNIHITNNIIQFSTTAGTVIPGIRLTAQYAGLYDIDISGNTIIDAGRTGSAEGSIRIYPNNAGGTYLAERIRICNNRIVRSGNYGIRAHYIRDCQICDNTFVNTGYHATTITTYDAIFIDDDAENCVIERNIVIDEGDGPDAFWHFDGTSTYTNLSGAYDRNYSTNATATTDATNDYLYVGNSHQFVRIAITFGVYNANAGTLSTYEYYNGSTWASLTGFADGTLTGGTTLAQNGSITWTRPTDWATTSVDGTTAYWVRFRPSADTSATRFDDVRTHGRTARALLTDGAIMTNSIIRDNRSRGGINTDQYNVGGDPASYNIAMKGNQTTEQSIVGTFTITAASSITLNTVAPNHATYSEILLIPTNLSAAQLQAGTDRLYPSAMTARRRITLSTAGGGNAAGTETFWYEIIQ